MSLTLLIVILTVGISLLAFNDPMYFYKLRHHPYTEFRQNEYYRWLTSSLLHADYMHLGINMLVFYQFGSVVESGFVDLICCVAKILKTLHNDFGNFSGG